MSLEAWGDDGGDDYLTPEQAIEAGWMMPDDVEELRDLFRHIDVPAEGTKQLAAFLLIENLLTSTVHAEGSDSAILLAWAKVKLSRDVLA